MTTPKRFNGKTPWILGTGGVIVLTILIWVAKIASGSVESRTAIKSDIEQHDRDLGRVELKADRALENTIGLREDVIRMEGKVDNLTGVLKRIEDKL